MATTWNANASAQVLAALSTPPSLNSGCDDFEMNYAYGKLTIAAASGNASANMVRIPAGKVKIFPTKSRLRVSSAMADTGTISVGLGSYINSTGSTVNADVDALLTATVFDANAASTHATLLGTVTNSEFCIDLETRTGVYVTAVAATADTAANGIVEVMIAYAKQG